MRILTFLDGEAPLLGVVTPRGVLDVAAASSALAAPGPPATEFFRLGLAGVEALTALVERAVTAAPALSEPWFHEERALTLGPCVLESGKILCVGLNYLEHAIESGAQPPTTPVLFSKFVNALAAHGQEIALPVVAREYDYEAELVVVMGRRAREVAVEEALEYVLGYCSGNDISARDLQMRTSQWLLGKTLDGFLPIGPYLVTADEVPDPQALSVRCWLNGDLRQDSRTADMIFSVAEIISYASHHFALEPGDIIATGTPQGVIFGHAERTWMKPGDVVSVEIGDLGRLTNPLGPAVATARSGSVG